MYLHLILTPYINSQYLHLVLAPYTKSHYFHLTGGQMQKIGSKITVTVPDEILLEIEEIAERFDLSKAEVSRLLIETGLDTYKSFQLLGVAKLTEVSIKVKTKLQEIKQKKTRMVV